MIIAENKRALRDYKILEKWPAGIKLTGPEVKTVKSGKIELKGSYVDLAPNKREIWLHKAQIAKYPKSGYSQKNYDPFRPRKLLLQRKEINSIFGKIKQKGLTIIPTLVYTSQRLIKIEIALVQGKKKYDKREDLKKRDFARRKARLLKQF